MSDATPNRKGYTYAQCWYLGGTEYTTGWVDLKAVERGDRFAWVDDNDQVYLVNFDQIRDIYPMTPPAEPTS